MKNKELARIFSEMAEFLEIEEAPFKTRAYQRVSRTLGDLPEDIGEIYKKGGEKAIEKISGIGRGIAERIIEYLRTGKIKEYQDYRRKYPFDIQELTRVEGLGPKTVRDLYQQLKVKNLDDLEKAAKEGKIRKLPNFGPRTEKNILQGIAFLKRSRGRFLLGEILPKVLAIEEKLKSQKEVKKADVCGSVRRREETVGDVDFLAATSSPEKVMEFFCSLPGIIKVWGRGKTKSSIRLEEGFDVDLRAVREASYGAALQYFTGSKEHNIELRKIASSKGYKLNEYGLFKGKKMVASRTERELYRALGMALPPPEIRENRGEIEAALRNKLPGLVKLRDIKGDLHTHSRWDGGKNTILEMARAAQGLGYQYLGISDHTKFLKIERGLDERQLVQQRKEIDRLNSKFQIPNSNQTTNPKSKFQILQGAETNILRDGTIDINDEALKKLDYAIGGVHSNFKISKSEMTERIIKAMKNPYIKIISHPTGRILKRRDEYQIDIGKILRAARETKTILEINAHPQRLDLSDVNARKAVEMGVKLIINTDAHHRGHLRYMEYGVATARRGWAEAGDVVNAYPLKELLKFFKK